MGLYRSLSLGEKATFLRYLAENYGVNQDSIVQVSESIIASKVKMQQFSSVCLSTLYQKRKLKQIQSTLDISKSISSQTIDILKLIFWSQKIYFEISVV